MRTLKAFLVALGASCLGSCGGSSPTQPTTPVVPTPAPAVTCPASTTLVSANDQPVPVVFVFPLATGGTPPVTMTCSAQPGQPFPVGSTTVTCTAADATGRQAMCSFTVTVRPSPKLTKTSFMAFGDSITEGTIANPLPSLFSLGLPHSYPYKLNDLMVARYTTQTVNLVNAGMPGEVASSAWSPSGRTPGEVRFRYELMQYRPQVALLMEGTNDLYFGLDGGVKYGILALDRMLQEARDQNVQVFLATLPPQRSGGAFRRDNVAALIPEFNAEVAALASKRGAVLVDVFSALNSDLRRYIGDDDLHPTEDGFRVMAETFLAAIKANLETAAQLQRIR